MFFKPKRIFLDHASTTPVLPEVLSSMLPFFDKFFFNPSAIYAEGKSASTKLLQYRTEVARILEVSSKDIVFLGSGTESDNLALLGVFEAAKVNIDKPHVIISPIEHPGIRETAKEIARRGGEVSIVSVDEDGRVDPQEVLRQIKPETVLISIMLANNETGVIEPIAQITRLVREYKKKNNLELPYVHTDASQAANYLRLSLPALGVDLLTLDGSKMYGPKGIGLLVVRPGVNIHSIIFGGGQEKGLRSGTESLALISGFARALEIAQRDRESESARLNILKEFFIKEINKSLPEAIINTPRENNLPNIVSVSIPGMLAEFVAIKFDKEGVMVSTGSSCGNTKDKGGSETLSALGKEDLRESTIRFSFGRGTTKKDLQRTIKIFKNIMRK